MARRLSFLSAGLLGLFTGCKLGGYVLPSSVASDAAFTPEGMRMIAFDQSTKELCLYDLAAKKALWRIPGKALAGFSFSPGGQLFVLVLQDPNDSAGELSLVEVATGKRLGAPRPLPKHQRSGAEFYAHQARDLTAVADDGSWLLTALDGSLKAIDAAGRAVPAGKERRGYVERLRLEAGGRRAAALWNGERLNLVVLEAGPDAWTETAELGEVISFEWVPQGLALLTKRGVEIWDGKTSRVVIPLGEDAYAMRAVRHPSVFISRDGRYAATGTVDQLNVYELAGGTKIFSHTESVKTRVPLLFSAAFSGDRLRAFLSKGDVIDVELGARRIARRKSYGSPGHYEKNWFQDGASWEENYSPTIGPGGRFVDLYAPDKGHTIYSLD